MSSFDKLIAEVASQTGLTRSQAGEAVRAVFESITGELESGEEVSIPRFGVFKGFYADARKARNPQTGEQIDVQAKIRPKFKPSSVLEKRLNPS